MSAEATAYVYRFSPFAGVTFQIHHAIADSVNDQRENEFWMGQEKLARKARVGRRSAQRALEELLANGFVELLREGATKGEPNLYRFLFPDVEVIFDSRPRTQGVRQQVPGGCAMVTQGVRHGDAGGAPTGTGGVRHGDARTQEVLTQEEPKVLFSASPSAETPIPSSKKTSTRKKPEDPEAAAREVSAQTLVAEFVDYARGLGKTALTAKTPRGIVARGVKELLAEGVRVEQIREGVRRAVRTNSPGRLAALVAGVQDQDGRAILPYDHPVSESARKLASARGRPDRDYFDEPEPSSLAEVFGGLGILPAGAAE